MARISNDQIGLRDAAELFGVSIDTLRRRIRDNQLEEALLVQGPFGATWVLPRSALSTIAEREHWDLDDVSRGAPPGQVAVNPLAPVSQAPVIDLTELVEEPDRALVEVAAVPSQPKAAPVPAAPVGPDGLGSGVVEELAKGLADNVHMELTAVREAITAAEVKAVAAEARTDSLMAEKSRLEAQLKRAEADIEYWRSQHDRLDRDLDRERGLRTSAEKAKAIADTEAGEARQRIAELSVDLHDTQARERTLIGAEAALAAELDHATMAMGWWSRRRLERLRSRSSNRTQAGDPGD
ncbi:MAG: hypothetical protein HKN24_12570 [Acidimicrobiales bacterium]|nr:hypothetical protein [Acidimicrobiales bacterium]